MALIDEIRAQARAEGRLIDSIDAAFAQELRGVLRRTNRQIRELVNQLETSGGRLVATRAQLGRALRLRAEIQTILESSGFTAVVNASVDQPFDRLAATVLRGRSITARAARVTPLDLDIIAAWKDMQRANLLELGDDLVTATWQGILDGALGNRSTAALTDEMAALYDVTDRQARTLYDTAASRFVRQVDQLGIEPKPTDRFQYVGPSDNKTRPFCAGLVGQVRTRAELDSLDNGQLPNTLLTGGGWNCRHKWFFLGDLSVEDLAA